MSETYLRPAPEQRRQLIENIWRRAPSMPLPLRIRNLRRAQQLVTLGRILDRRDAEAAGIAEHDANAAATRV
jgi:hypothetical protein